MMYNDALYIAEWLRDEMKPACARIEIGGGVRRGKADVHDIEIIAVPLFIPTRDLFGTVISNENQLDAILCELEGLAALKRVKGGEKFKQFEIGRWEEFAIQRPDQSFKLDLFLVTPPASWGAQFVIRTGPAEFSQWMVTKKMLGGALPDHCYVKGGAIWDGRDGSKIEMPEETDFFRLCGLDWIEPGQRAARWKR
jgi:DNA polymerase/3'-5' exonuclease PolX